MSVWIGSCNDDDVDMAGYLMLPVQRKRGQKSHRLMNLNRIGQLYVTIVLYLNDPPEHIRGTIKHSCTIEGQLLTVLLRSYYGILGASKD